MIVSRSQRWRDRRARFVPSASVIDPRDYAVDVIPCASVAKPFVTAHHYSASFPASRLSVGLYRRGAAARTDLVGVATFSVPMNGASIRCRTGLDAREGVDLGRLVLLDDVPGNGETWFLSRALRALRREKPEVAAVVSYADPSERRTPDGELVKPGHIGTIYAAASAAYRGRTRARNEYLAPDGQTVPERSLSKLRGGERGAGGVVDALVSRGAPPPADDDLRAWATKLRETGFLRTRRHDGQHVYTFALTKSARLAGRGLPSLPYPVAGDIQAANDALPLFAAARAA